MISKPQCVEPQTLDIEHSIRVGKVEIPIFN